MKRFLPSMVILISLLLNSCSTETPVSPDTQKGRITLNIDRAHKPANVVSVTAYLTREGFNPINGALNLLSDTTAEISFNDLAAGQWHLKVDAADEDSTIVYTGETDVNILAGITTQVYLTLVPTGAGKGNIYIYVNWGIPQNTNWIDYPGNPIMLSQFNYWDYAGVSQCKILFENGTYKMWYLGLANNGEAHVGYAESIDGINWMRPYSNPVLSPGNYNDWDGASVGPGAVIKENGIYMLYYVGWQNQNSNWNIGLATSSDGINWTKYSNNPILVGTSGWEYQIVPASILKLENTYYLYYFGRNLPEYKIGLATSNDAINWTKYGGNPILTPTESWEVSGVFHPSVIDENGSLKMIYGNSSATGFGIATSFDGISWTKSSSNPFFTRDETSNNWGSYKIMYPFFMKTSSEYRVYYSGLNSPNSILSLGFAKKVIQ